MPTSTMITKRPSRPFQDASSTAPSKSRPSAMPRRMRATPVGTLSAIMRWCSSYPQTSVGGPAGMGAAVAGAARPVRSPVTSSSSVQSKISHILSSLSISGWLFSASHFVTLWRETPSSMASCSWVMLRSARRC